METRPWSFAGPWATRSHPISKRMPTMRPSSGAKSRRLSKLERTTEGTGLLASEERDLRGPRRAHDVEEVEHALVDELEQRLRPEPEHEHDDRERHERRDLARVDLGEFAAERFEVMAVPPFVLELAEEHALKRPEVVGRGDDDARRGEDGHHAVHGEGAHEREDLADESGEPRQAERGHEREADERRVERHLARQPAESSDLAGVRAVV